MQPQLKNFTFTDNSVPVLQFTHQGGTQQFSFKSNGPCFLTIPEEYKSWISISKVEHRGEENVVEVTTAQYTGEGIHEGAINVYCLDEEVEVPVLQYPYFAVFKDPFFERYILEHFDTDKDGKISAEEAATITEINVIDYEDREKITSLEGIEFLPNLQSLILSNDNWENRIPLYQLDVRKNKRLSVLNCAFCNLTQLDVSQNKALTKLVCWYNELTQLDVSKNANLTELRCSGNQLTQLDVSKNANLTELWCSRNQLTQLDISRNTVLTKLVCRYDQLTQLDVSKNTALTELECDYNQLTHLDVSKNKDLNSLYCDNNQLTHLDVSKNKDLNWLYCEDNQLTHLDLTKNTKLKWPHINANPNLKFVYVNADFKMIELKKDDTTKIIKADYMI